METSEQKHIFNTWLTRYKALLFKVVRAYASRPEDREDLFQEIAIQLWYSVPNFQQKSTVATWVYRVSLNTAIHWVRKESKHRHRRQSIENVASLLYENDHEMEERLAWLYGEIARFDKIDRSLILLLLDGFGYREIAEILGISESNVGVKIHRIKKYLITKSEKYDYYGV